MYTSFYNLKLKPFQINPDPSFMWLGEKHKKALDTLKFGILNNKGFLLLTGDVGTGKTTLINALIQGLSKDVIYASIPDSNLEFIDFLYYVSSLFGMDTKVNTKESFVNNFKKFLLDASQQGKKVLLIIDEAQLLTYDLLEQIRLLSNIDLAETKLLNVFFVGQNEFNDTLSKIHNRPIRQRLTLNYNIAPLTLEETNEYIKYRLKVAGTISEIFSHRAIEKIHLHSEGLPRRINIICDSCMLSGYINGKKAINQSIVNKCARELELPSEAKPKILDLIAQSIFSKKRTLLGLNTSIKTIGYLLIGFTLWLCSIAIVFFYLYPAIIDKRTDITTSTISSVKTIPDQQSDQSERKVKVKKTEPPLEIKKIIIRFKDNTNDFTADSIVKINKFTEIFQKYPGAQFVVTGYTDSIGNPEYNKKISTFRANIVKSFLMGKGIKPEQIQKRGLGDKNPVESNDTSSGRMMNRRVEVEFSLNSK